MEEFHFQQAQSQLKSRDYWLQRKKLCGHDNLMGIERFLYGHLAYLQEARPKPDFSDAKTRVVNLCIQAFRPVFSANPDDSAASLLESGAEDWLDDLFAAVDITGFRNWAPILQALVSNEALNDAAAWRILGRFGPGLAPREPEPDTGSFSWQQAWAGQLPYRVRNGFTDLEAHLADARGSLADPARQEDQLWLTLGLLSQQQDSAALGHLQSWLTACPGSRQALCAATVSGDPEFTITLQAAVEDELIPTFWLAVHGDIEHLPFCLRLLEQPRWNRAIEPAWYAFTGVRLQRVPRLTLGEHSKGDRMADYHSARAWYESQAPKGRLCHGQPIQPGDPRPEQWRYFGEDAEPAMLGAWVGSQGKLDLNPMECHWQRILRIKTGATS